MEKATQIYNNMYDNENLEKVLDIYGDKLTFFINSMIQDINVSEDLMMDSFVEILSRKVSFLDENTFKAYIYKTAKNKAINYIKKKKHTVEIDYDNVASVQDEDEFSLSETKKILFDIIKNFKPLYNSVLYLSLFEEMSLEEISQILEKSTRQVRNIKYCAMKKLREELSKKSFNLEVL